MMTALETVPRSKPRPEPRRSLRERAGSVPALLLVLVAVIVTRDWLRSGLETPAGLSFATLLSSMLLGGLPFVLLAAVVSAAVASFVPAGTVDRLLGRLAAPPVARVSTVDNLATSAEGVATVEASTVERQGAGRWLAMVVTAAGVGALLAPGRRRGVAASAGLLRRGSQPAAVFAYLVGSACTPVALVATAVAFPGQPLLVPARAAAGALTAVAMARLWQRWGRPEWLPGADAPASDDSGTDGCGQDRSHHRGLSAFWAACSADVVRGGTALAIGAAVVAGLQVLSPPHSAALLAARVGFSAVALALLAVLLGVPAEANAFIAVAFPLFAPEAALAFMVVGPVADLRQLSWQTEAFGPRLAGRFTLAAFAVALFATATVAWLAGSWSAGSWSDGSWFAGSWLAAGTP